MSICFKTAATPSLASALSLWRSTSIRPAASPRLALWASGRVRSKMMRNHLCASARAQSKRKSATRLRSHSRQITPPAIPGALRNNPIPRFSNSSAKNMMTTAQVAWGLAGWKLGRFRRWLKGLRHSFSNTRARSKKMCRRPRLQSSELQFSRNVRQIAEPAGVTLLRARPPYHASP